MTFRLLPILILAGVLFFAPVLLNAQEDSSEEIPSGVTIHVVQRGENLFRIALHYGTSVDELASLNGLSDATRILVGQRLLVPSSVTVEPVPQTHTIQPGETLFTIAQLYETDIETLIALNSLADANQIYPGQILTITAPPETATIEATESAEIEATSEPEVEATELPEIAFETAENGYPTISANLHIVQSGETLFRIALRYGLTVQELASANGLADPTVIYVGQQLIIPASADHQRLSLIYQNQSAI